MITEPTQEFRQNRNDFNDRLDSIERQIDKILGRKENRITRWGGGGGFF